MTRIREEDWHRSFCLCPLHCFAFTLYVCVTETAGKMLSSFTTRHWLTAAIVLLVTGILLGIGGCVIAAVGFGLSAKDMYDYPNLWVPVHRTVCHLSYLLEVEQRTGVSTGLVRCNLVYNAHYGSQAKWLGPESYDRELRYCHGLHGDDIVALSWHNDIVVLQYSDSESDQ